MKKRIKRSNQNVKGLAMVLTLFVMTILSVIGFGLVTLTTGQGKTVINRQISYQALNNAKMGIYRAMAEIQCDDYWGMNPATGLLDGSVPACVEDLGTNGKYTVSVFAPASNNSSSDKRWKVYSVGEKGTSKRMLVAWFEKPSFAEYGWFTNNEVSETGNTIWWVGDTNSPGRSLPYKMHTNGTFNVVNQLYANNKITSSNMIKDSTLKDADGKPVWVPEGQDSVATKNTKGYYNNVLNRYYPDKVNSSSWYTTSTGRFHHVFPNNLGTFYYDKFNWGSGYFAGGMPVVEIPPTSNVEGYADKKYLNNPDSNPFVPADPLNPTGPQIANPNYKPVKLTFDSAGTVTVEYDVGSGPQTEVLPTDKLTIYSTGPIEITGGQVKGKVTVANGAGMDILLKNSVQYVDRTTDNLGLVAGHSVVLDTPVRFDAASANGSAFAGNTPERAAQNKLDHDYLESLPDAATNHVHSDTVTNINVEAAIIAESGAFSVRNYDKGLPRGTINHFGNRATSFGGERAIWDYVSMTQVCGFLEVRTYDTKLVSNPPPNFPTTATLRVLSMQDSGAPDSANLFY